MFFLGAMLVTVREHLPPRIGMYAGLGLVVVGSRPEAEEGRVSLSAASENLIENAGCPVLVVPRGKALAFDGHVVAAA